MTIQIFTTGGTIDKIYFDAKSEFEVGDPQIVDIFREANVRIEWELTTLFRKDSLDISNEDRDLIVKKVRDCTHHHILITHGSDTMPETAAALQSVSGKTIVLVGSLTPARFKHSDAIFNIGFALGALSALQPGVFIAMNGQIFSAGHVRKNRALNRFEQVD